MVLGLRPLVALALEQQQQQGEKKQQDGDQSKVGQDKTDRLSAELQSLRASQEALAGQVRSGHKPRRAAATPPHRRRHQ
jgi:hypothetical protein